MMRTDAQLEADIRAELAWDPKVEHAGEIAVAVDRGRVSLRGTVGSLHQRASATAAAKRVLGTYAVDDQLDVRIGDQFAREDADIREAGLHALAWNALVPADRIDLAVDDGHAVLTGTADWPFEQDAAETTVAILIGVIGVRNEIEVESTPTEADEMVARIEQALRRRAQTHAGSIRVAVSDGAVILEGAVTSWAQHDEVVATVSAAPGVRLVDDRLSMDGRASETASER
jgi:osmotically-inducible protein OsmY